LKVLLLTVWKPKMGGIVTHVENLMKHSKKDFEIITYPSWARLPLLRPLGFILWGFLAGLRKDFDIIHAHYALPQGLLGVMLGLAKRRPLVLTLHGSDILVLGRKRALRPLLGWLLRRCDRIIAVSAYLKQEAMGLGAEEARVRVVHGGVDLPDKIPAGPAGCKTVTFIGALVPQKGVDVLLDAFKEVRARLPEVSLVIVGDGPERNRLEQMVEDLGLSEVAFLGFVDDLERVYEKTCLLVLPSREEGFGLVLLEAMARGVPVVATEAGGIPEVLGPEYAALVRPGDRQGLAEVIIRVLEDKGLREELSRLAMERVREFSWEKMGKEVDALYEELVRE
jgi:glycosyltransferase involved in cell wall biosynthesis